MILIKNQQRKIKLNAAQIKKTVQAILDILDYHDVDIGILCTTNATMQKYNLMYRGKDKPTDILSFPTNPDLKPGERLQPEDGETNLGDIILAPEYITADAARRRVSFEKRLVRLLVHGICHLLGYDHETDAEYKVMLAQEKRILAKLRLRI